MQRLRSSVLQTIICFPVILSVTACTLLPTPTPTPTVTPTPTFQQQRAKVVSFLKQLNQVNNNFADAFKLADIGSKFANSAASGDEQQMDIAFKTFINLIAGYQTQLGELLPPADIRELAGIKRSKEEAVTEFMTQLLKLLEAAQAEDLVQILRISQEMGQWTSGPDITRGFELQELLLAKYNIPDTAVDYRR